MTVLHSWRPDARAGALALLARRQGAPTLVEAREHGRGFTLDEALDAWSPRWRDNPPPPQMGLMARRLRQLTYCVFVGIWEDEVGFLLEHPVALPPKSVTTAYTTKEDDWTPRAYLTVVMEDAARVLVPFPHLDDAVLASAESSSFSDSLNALERVMDEMVERVNLAIPGLHALAAATSRD